jgi:hypothetical protein
VSWLWTERQRSQELQDIVHRALSLSICRYDPCAEGVAVRVKQLEDQMWEHAKNASSSDRGPKASLKRKFRGTGSSSMHLPGWKEELQNWVEGATAALGWDSLPGPQPGCVNFPNAATLAERFPHMFYREVHATGSKNERLLTALDEADNLSSAAAGRDATAQWQATAAAMLGTAIGLGVDEIIELSGAAPEIASGVAGGFIGVVVLRIVKMLRARVTPSQRDLHEQARCWTQEFLMERTGRKGDRSVDEMFHEWVSCESASPSSSSAPANIECIAKLTGLIETGQACREHHFVRAAIALRKELESNEHSEQTRYRCHGLIWRLWGAPAGT